MAVVPRLPVLGVPHRSVARGAPSPPLFPDTGRTSVDATPCSPPQALGPPPGPRRGTPQARSVSPHCHAYAHPASRAAAAPPSAAHAQTEEPLCESAPPIFTRPRGRAGRSRGLGGVRLRPREPNRRGGLRPPRRRERLDLPGFAGDRAPSPVEMGGTQRIEAVPQAVRMAGGRVQPGGSSAHRPRSSRRRPTFERA